jgi:hypothetical protein
MCGDHGGDLVGRLGGDHDRDRAVVHLVRGEGGQAVGVRLQLSFQEFVGAAQVRAEVHGELEVAGFGVHRAVSGDPFAQRSQVQLGEGADGRAVSRVVGDQQFPVDQPDVGLHAGETAVQCVEQWPWM